jgi:hypothetical protein
MQSARNLPSVDLRKRQAIADVYWSFLSEFSHELDKTDYAWSLSPSEMRMYAAVMTISDNRKIVDLLTNPPNSDSNEIDIKELKRYVIFPGLNLESNLQKMQDLKIVEVSNSRVRFGKNAPIAYELLNTFESAQREISRDPTIVDLFELIASGYKTTYPTCKET